MGSRLNSLNVLQQTLQFEFADHALLQQALTHRSFSSMHNERLEFLGDSVLNCVVSQILYKRFPNDDEGKLSRIRSHLVRQDCLAKLGEKLALSSLLRLGEGEVKSGGALRPSILADTVEAIIGAISIDAGFEKAAQITRELIEPLLDEIPSQSLGKDAKTRLQEVMQAAHMPLPAYKVLVEGGTAHSPVFEVLCDIPSLKLSQTGQGSSRRAAEQEAAERLFERLPSFILKKVNS